jgi:hypothetical protein
MASYTLSREAFDLLVEAFGEKQKADKFAKAIESAIDEIRKDADKSIVEKKKLQKLKLKKT